MILHKPCQIVTPICMRTTLAVFINIRTLRKLKMFQTRNLQMWANVLLIITCQLNLEKIQIYAIFLVWKKDLSELNIAYDINRIKQFHMVEYLNWTLI